ncbi:unnamed protein product [Rhizoctonia solani]|nr:unnamed protein product [Rhizoctonia solani]
MGQSTSMPIIPPGPHHEWCSPSKRPSSRSAVQRRVPLDSFTEHEENQLSIASALMFAAAVGSQRPANTNILVGEDSEPSQLPFTARIGSTRPCPSPPNQPNPKRRKFNQPTANLSPLQLSSGGQSYPLTPYGATNMPTGPPIDPIAWNVTALTNGVTGDIPETPYPLLRPPGPLGSFLPCRNTTPSTTANNHIPIHPSAQVFPLPLVSAMFLPKDQLDLELSACRSGMLWTNWEDQIILSKLLGPGAQVHFITILLREPRTTAHDSELNPVWSQLSVVSFRSARTVVAVLARWGLLVDTCNAILYFAVESGLDLYSPEFQDVELFVNQVITMWRCRVPEGEIWGTDLKLKPTDVAAWTHDPKNGWLAMMYRRLRESSVSLPLMEVPEPSPPRWCSSRQSHCYELANQAAIPLITPDNQFANNHEPRPVPEGYSRGWEMLRDHRIVSTASTSVANAKAEWIHSQAVEVHAAILDRILERVYNDRDKRLELAMLYLKNTPDTSPIRSHLDAWVIQECFSSHPMDEVKSFISHWVTRIGFTPVANLKPDGAQAVSIPPVPPLVLPDHSSQLDRAHSI